MYRIRFAIALYSFTTSTKVELVAICGTDGEADIVSFAIVDAASGVVVNCSESVTHELVTSEAPHVLAKLEAFAARYRLNSHDLARMLAAADASLKAA